MNGSSCELCAHYAFDDQCGCYVCTVNLDIDEMEHFLRGNTKSCAYFSSADEYAIVRKQN